MPTSITEVLNLLGKYGKVEEIHKDTYIVKISPDKVRELCEILHWKLKGHFSVTVGSDERPINGYFGVYHVFLLDKQRLSVIVHVKVNPVTLKIPSITPIIPGANWHEREAHDFFGILFEEHPSLERLILPYDWPEGVYPLRKDVGMGELKHKLLKKEKGLVVERKVDEEYVVPIGPYHPALHEPEYFELYVEGEKIVDAKYKGFHVHRGIEKVAEERLTINQVPFIAERICGICGYTHNVAYCQAVENAAKINVPLRAKYIRSILLEIERIHSHLLWFGVLFHLLGFDTGFMMTWLVREKIMDLAEILTGNRKNYGLNLVGGVRRDIDSKKIDFCLKTLDYVENKLRRILNKMLGLKEIVSRTKGVGFLSRDEARKLSVVGPVARASGVETDVRKYHPYAAYGEIEFKVPVYDEGDVYSRALVRYDEVFESINMLKQLLKNIPKGNVMADSIEIPEYRKGLGLTEAPRGENVHLVITGRDNKIYRWRPRAPSYNNIPSTLVMLKGENLADAPAIIASIDPCFSCTDHVVVIDIERYIKRRICLKELVKRRIMYE